MKRIFLTLFMCLPALGVIHPPLPLVSSKRAAAGAAAYDPNADATAVRWYRAEGTVGTNVNNFAVTNLLERKGLGFPLTNLTALADGPILTNNYVNGKAAMGFYTTNILAAAIGNLNLAATEAHMFMVLKAGFDDAAHSLIFWNAVGADVTGNYYPFADNGLYLSFGTTARKTVGDPSPDLTQWRLLEIVTKAGEWTLYLDGTQVFTTASNTVGWDNSQVMSIGGNSAPPATGVWIGFIAEWLICDTVKTGSDRTSILTYFDTEYNLSY